MTLLKEIEGKFLHLEEGVLRKLRLQIENKFVMVKVVGSEVREEMVSYLLRRYNSYQSLEAIAESDRAGLPGQSKHRD